MDPNIWGPRLWFSIHSMSFTYPFYPTDKDKEIYKNYYKLLEHTLPCGLCRNNYKKPKMVYPCSEKDVLKIEFRNLNHYQKLYF